MYSDEFETRLARVRHRFAIALESKIEGAIVSVNLISRGGDGLIKHLAGLYRHLHAICGIGPTVGFSATGEAARIAEVALVPAHREGRRLTETETLNLKKALERLRVAAASELRLMYQRGG
jgi:hypothetical protein